MISPTDAPLYTDLYQLTMAQGYWATGRADEPAVFDYFFRTNPFSGGFVVFAGLEDAVSLIADMRFDEDGLGFLREQGFRDDFLSYLRGWRFRGDLLAVREGEIVFPRAPVVQVRASILDAQLLETLLLNLLNFPSLIATKAARMVLAADGRGVLDFGLRRAQGYGGIQASRAAAIGGCVATSNVFAAKRFGLQPSGTMAHAWVQSFDDERVAFERFVETYGARSVLLVDTYDTLKSGVPNAIAVARRMKKAGESLLGIRLDSGDLAYLSKKARAQLDEAGLHEVKIAASNNLDEHLIKSLLDQGAPIDIFGVGTRLLTAYEDPALDGVYKLSMSGGEPRIKVSENVAKMTLPGVKRVERLTDKDGRFYADAIALDSEGPAEHLYHPVHPRRNTAVASYEREDLLQPVIAAGRVVQEPGDWRAAAAYRQERLAQVPEEHLRFQFPHEYKVGITRALMELRDKMVDAAFA